MAHKLATCSRVGAVDNRHGHLSYHLVVVYPRVEERIGERQEDYEEQCALVAEHLKQFVEPHLRGIFPKCMYLLYYHLSILKSEKLVSYSIYTYSL